jgi:hypothetical protein
MMSILFAKILLIINNEDRAFLSQFLSDPVCPYGFLKAFSNVGHLN